MWPIIPIIIAGGVITATVDKRRRRKTARSIARLDKRCQKLIRDHLDPKLLGKKHVQQLQAMNGGLQREQPLQEKKTNRRLLLGVTSLSLIGLNSLVAIPLVPLIAPIALYSFWPLLTESWRLAFHERRFSLLHILVIYLSGMWLTGSYLVGVLGIIFININSKVLSLSQTVTRHNLTNLLGEAPQKVWIIFDGAEIEIPFEELQIGSILVLQAGQSVPIDGTVVSGSATVDQHRLTGESQPAEKVVGDSVFASTLLLSGYLQVQVDRAGEDTAAAKVGAILNNTIDYQKTHLAEQYTFLESTRWPVLMGGAAGLIIGGPFTAFAILGCNFTTNMVPLSFLTLLNGLKSAASQGILIKDGGILEQLPKIDTIVFDKTGTLTTDQPQIKEIHCADGYTPTELLRLAAGAEQHQSHPIAEAILAEAAAQSIEIPEIDDANYQLGLGLFVKINDQALHIGSERFLTTEGIPLPLNFEQIKLNAHTQGNALIFLAIDNKTIGAIELVATLRPDAKATIDWLKQQGIALYILSGDQEGPTRHLSDELGMDGYFANTLPEQKAEQIRTLQEQGRQVCFIGDGINDALALQQAEVSISLCGATTIATDVAQVVLMDDDLSQLTVLWRLAQGYEKNLKTNNNLTRQMSVASAVGVTLLPFKFWIVESLWLSNAIVGMKLANNPLLKKDKTNPLTNNSTINLSYEDKPPSNEKIT